jgi:tRNA 2-selenouridine synthase
MRINKVSFTDKTIDQYSVIIDVRTPLEYKEDHIPGSLNYAVLTNKQRHEIGIKYKENSFLAKKIGAQLISQNIAKILGKISFDKKDTILIYCWRGGLRSLSLYLVLKQIGYDVYLLDGGYKAYRRNVVNYLEVIAPKFRYNQVMGITGVGKTLFLKELSKNYQTIDFEGLANHKGSILGNIPNKIQPSQKYFETLIYEKLKRFNAKKRVWVEAESIKVGSSLDERVKYILKDYKYFTSDPKLMSEALRVLKQIIPKEDFSNIEKSLKKKNYYEFVKALIIYHYDKAYKKTRAESTSIVFDEIYLEKINLSYIRRAISTNKSF